MLHAPVWDSKTWTKLLLQYVSDQLELVLFPLIPKYISQFNFKEKNDFAVVAVVGSDSSSSLVLCLFTF